MVELENRNANGSSNALPGEQPTSGPGAGQGTSGLEQQARQKTEEAKEQIHSLAEAGKDRIAEQLDHLARALRATGDNLRGEEQQDLSYYTDSASERIERASRYLREHRAIDLVDGVERFARERPGLFLGGALVFGLAIGRFVKSRPEEGSALEEGYAMGGYDVEEGYPEPREPVVTAPVEIEGASEPSSSEPSTSYPYQPPSGTFRGPGDGGRGQS